MTKKKTFVPRHLLLRGKTYYVVLDIPKDVRAEFSFFRFCETTGERDIQQAQRIAIEKVTEWKKQIQQAGEKHSNKIINSANQLRNIYKDTNRSHLVEDILNEKKQEFIEKLGEKKGNSTSEFFEKIVKGNAVTLQSHLNDYLKYIEQQGLAKQTREQKKRDLQEIIDEFVFDTSLTTQRVRNWALSVGYNEEFKNGKTPASLERYYKAGSSFWRYLVEERIIKDKNNILENPFKNLPSKFKRNTNPNSLFPKDSYIPWTNEELEKIYQTTIKENNNKLANLIKICAYQGTRIEEICSLKIEDIDLKNQTIHIKRTTTKNDSSARTIPIHSKLKKIIEELVDLSDDDYLISGENISTHGKRQNRLGKHFTNLKRSLGFTSRNKCFHSIRKTFVTQLQNANVNESWIANIVGHKWKSETFGTYSGGISIDNMRKTIEKVKFNF
jgi:integrase